MLFHVFIQILAMYYTIARTVGVQIKLNSFYPVENLWKIDVA